MLENWVSIPGYDGYYEASDLGRVRSIGRDITVVKGTGRHFNGKILKQIWSGHPGKEYFHVGLSKGGVKETWPVHRLVALTFIGPLPDGRETRHLDGDRRNNTLSNLKYGTNKENTEDAIRHGTARREAESNPSAKLSWCQVFEIRNSKRPAKQMAKELGISIWTIFDIRSGKRSWKLSSKDK